MNRRTLLNRSIFGSGALVLSPILAQIEAQAAGTATGGAKRFVFVVEGNGLPPNQITPTDIKRNKQHERTEIVSRPIASDTLPESLQPIADYQQLLTVVNGLSGKIAGGGHSNDYGALGCYNCGGGVGNSGAPSGETIDVAIGKKLGGIFNHVGLGIVEKLQHNIVYNCSAWDVGKPMPTIVNPKIAYGNLFGSVAGGSAKAEFQAKTNVLDFLRDDLKRLESRVAGPEKAKLDAHLAAYEAMRNRQSKLGEIEGTLRRNAPEITDKYESTVETDRLDAMFDLAAASLIGGLTNVVTLASGAGNPFFGVKFTGLGIDFGKHGIGHGGSYNGMSAQEMMVKIRKFHFELIAGLMRKLEAVPEGNGSMLDNTVIVYLSDAAEGHHSRCWEWPFVVLGKAGGLSGGRYVEYPYWGKPGHREIGNLYTSFLSLVGEERDYFGVHDSQLPAEASGNGVLPELFA